MTSRRSSAARAAPDANAPSEAVAQGSHGGTPAGAPEDWLQFEALTAEIHSDLMEAPREELAERIHGILLQVGQLFHADHVRVLMLERHGEDILVQYEVAAAAALPVQRLEVAEVNARWPSTRISQGEVVAVGVPADLPRNAAEERARAKALGLRSMLYVPLAVPTCTGCHISIGRSSDTSDWGESECRLLQVVGRMLSSAVSDRISRDLTTQHLRFEELIADISHRLAVATPQELDAKIIESLGDMGNFLGVDFAAVMQRKHDDEPWSHTHEWTSPGWPGEPMSFQDVDVKDTYPWLYQRLSALEPVAIEDPSTLPAEAVSERHTCEAIGIKSVLWTPFQVDGVIEGFMCFDALTRPCPWTRHTIRRLTLTGEAIGNALARAHTLTELEHLNGELQADNDSLREMVSTSPAFEGIVWRSDALSGVLYQIEQVAKTDTTILLLGETGTGKELMAQAAHSRSNRADRPLVTVNCAALPSTLIESELFGHEKGAFTGAISKRIGRFGLANRGTLFLDEIGDLPLDLQAKLLRVLQQGEFEPLGSTETTKVDVRVIAATNADLKAGVEQGTFRSDLFYRLNVFPITVPPLRERRTDIPLLVWYFIDKHKRRLSTEIREVPRATMDWLCAYDFPGNVRELENIIERAIILSPGDRLEVAFDTPVGASTPAEATAGETLAEVERAHITRVLEACDWRIKGKGNAAERLALHPNTLRFRMSKLGVKRPGS